MAAGKWIGGFIGWMAGGPLGALAGLAIGAMFDCGVGNGDKQARGNDFSSAGGYDNRNSYEGQRNGFLFSLLVLASYIIRADGRVMHSEMNIVRRFLSQNFGDDAVKQGEDILSKLFDVQKQQGISGFKNTVADCCAQIAANMDYSQRLELLSLLVLISQADGNVAREEIEAMKECARWMQMTDADVDSMLNLKGNTLDDAYKVIGVEPTATDDEVRQAYRKLALQHHPDRVAALGDDIRKAAEEKFKEINEAKERIFKARGI